MRFYAALSFVLILTLSGCGAYKELKPKPPIVPMEGNYIELTRSKSEKKTERFELKRGKKYFIKFPAPPADAFYIVIKTDQKPILDTYFTGSFSKGKRPDPHVRDEGGKPGESAYRIDRSAPLWFWVIETVGQDMTLALEYRYAPVWRYTFENRHAAFQERLAQNRVDRGNYNNLGVSFRFINFNFGDELGRVGRASTSLQTLAGELQELERLFPPSLLNSDDPAYRNFVDLREKIGEERRFQDNYRDVLNVFRAEAESRDDIGKLLAVAPMLNTFLTQTDRFPAPALSEARNVLGGRLSGVVPHMERIISGKTDVSPIQFGFKLADIEALYRNCGQTTPQNFRDLVAFINAYNSETERLVPAQKKLTDAARYSRPDYTWPSNTHYNEGLNHIAELNRILPEQRSATFQTYSRFRCVGLLNQEASRIRDETVRLGRDYATAQGVVEQVNALRPQRAYRAIIQLLTGYRRLDFLLQQYPDVDQLSLDQQQTGVTVALESRNWPESEQLLRDLYQDEMFLRLDRINPVKRAAVERLEGALASGVEQASKQRVDAFVAANRLVIDNVEGLYADSAFVPVYTLTFTSGTAETLRKRNADVQSYIDNLKYISFPSSAITELYRDFTRNFRDRGVEKARAIVVHGKYYKGDDRQIKNLVDECNPSTPKWITRPAEYRKVYALPITSNPRGENTYMVRLNIRIPSEAKFPVFDINLKLPKEVASGATTRQWYEHLKLNDEILRPQGRFTITAPTPQNGYEAQLTPVQVRAEGNNVFEMQFKHNSFQVFEISAMSQRPIMRRD